MEVNAAVVLCICLCIIALWRATKHCPSRNQRSRKWGKLRMHSLPQCVCGTLPTARCPTAKWVFTVTNWIQSKDLPVEATGFWEVFSEQLAGRDGQGVVNLQAVVCWQMFISSGGLDGDGVRLVALANFSWVQPTNTTSLNADWEEMCTTDSPVLLRTSSSTRGWGWEWWGCVDDGGW